MFKIITKKENKSIDYDDDFAKNKSTNNNVDSLDSTNIHNKTLSFSRALASKSLHENMTSILEKDSNLNTIILESYIVNNLLKDNIEGFSENIHITNDSSAVTLELFKNVENISNSINVDINSLNEMSNYLLNKISRTSANMEKLIEVFEKMLRQHEDISNITSAIHDITKSIDMLAINASIEASRSGEHGKGFAVVASEVKKLSDSTSLKNEEIKENLYIVSKSINELSSIIKDSNEMLTETAKQAQSTQKIIKSIYAKQKDSLDSIYKLKDANDSNQNILQKSNELLKSLSYHYDEQEALTKQILASCQTKMQNQVSCINILEQLDKLEGFNKEEI